MEDREGVGELLAAGRKLKLVSGANAIDLDLEGKPFTIEEVRSKMKEVLNLKGDEVVLVNGARVANPADYLLNGTENVEFVRQAEQKG